MIKKKKNKLATKHEKTGDVKRRELGTWSGRARVTRRYASRDRAFATAISGRMRRENRFFSSRRRHTRYIGDWSSDVCSSDPSRRRHRDTSVTGVQTCALPILASASNFAIDSDLILLHPLASFE